MAQDATPVARHAPARSEPGHEPVHPGRLDANGGRVTVGATVAARQYQIEDERRRTDSGDEQAYENDDEDGGVGHRTEPPLPRNVAGGGSPAVLRPLDALLHLDPGLHVHDALLHTFDHDIGVGVDSSAVHASG